MSKSLPHTSLQNLLMQQQHLATEETYLRESRQAAFEHFVKQGFPSQKHEEWKYTNLLPTLKKEYQFPTEYQLSPQDLKAYAYPGLEAIHLVFVNGRFEKSLSNLAGEEDKLQVLDFSEADAKVLKPYFDRQTNSGSDPLVVLNKAMARHGAFVTVKANQHLSKPLFLQYFFTTQASDVFVQLRNLILVEKNATLTAVESCHTLGNSSSFTNAYTDIILQENAVLDFYKVQNDKDTCDHIDTTEILHEGKSVSSTTTLSLGGGLLRNNLNITLKASHSEAHLNGLFMLHGKRHVDNHTVADHASPHCYSNELYKGILDGQSTGVFNGKIFVRQDAQKTNAFQSNKNILLSKEASINTKPQLEIFADDVKCSHGATTGQLDEESLFYLRSRGIGEGAARVLLMHAFANDVIEKVKIEPLRLALLQLIEAKLS